MAKEKQERFITPTGIAVFPWINRVDTKFSAAGKYSCKLRLDPTDATIAALLAKLDASAGEKFEEVKAGLKNPKAKGELKLSLPYEPEFDAEGNETGMILLYASQGATIKTDKGDIKMKVGVADSKGVALTKIPAIYGGSKLKMLVQYNPYAAQGKAGLALRLVAVQVIDLVSGTGDGNYGFGAEEGGFTAADDDFGDSSNESSTNADDSGSEDF